MSIDDQYEFPETDRRGHVRFALPAMYTRATVRRSLLGSRLAIQVLEGHAYDISEGGVRLEVDEALTVGELVRVTIELSAGAGLIDAWAEVVRVNDEEDDPAARRAGLRFREFITPADHARLLAFLGACIGGDRRAA